MSAPAPLEEDPERPVRCFVALPVADHVRTLLEAARAPAMAAAPELTWTRPTGWHVTLAFVGDLPAADLGHLGAVVEGAAATAGAVELSLGRADRFGDHALWVEVRDAPQGAVATLGGAVQRALDDAGLPVDRRPVRPHLTLARGGRGRRPPVDEAAVAAVARVGARWEVDEVVVVRSVLGEGPARYEPLLAVPLGLPPTPSG